MTVSDLAGWLGAALVLGSYSLVSLGRIEARTNLNQAMNVAGAAGLAWNGYVHDTWPIFTLDAIWALVGVIAIVSIARSRRHA